MKLKFIFLFFLFLNFSYAQISPPRMLFEGKEVELEQFLQYNLSNDSQIRQLFLDTCLVRFSFAKFTINKKRQVQNLFFLADSSALFDNSYKNVPSIIKERIEYYLRNTDGKWPRNSINEHFFLPITLSFGYHESCSSLNFLFELNESFYSVFYINYDKGNEYGYLGDWRFMKNKRFYGTILNSVNVQPPMTVECFQR